MVQSYLLNPPRTGLKVPPHQDNYYWAIDDANALTFWISLDSSNKKMEEFITIKVLIN